MKRRYAVRCCVAGAAAARTGEETAGPALLLAGAALTGSSGPASFVLAGLTVSAAVGGPLFGALLDRSAAPGRVLGGALALHGAGLMAILATLGRLPLAATVAVAVVAGLSGPALSAGWSSQLARVARGVGLRRAHAWDAMTFDAAGLAGPVLAAVVAALVGAPAAVVVSAALVGGTLPMAWRLPPRRAGGLSPVRCGAVLAGSADGLRVIVRTRPLARATLTSVTACVAQGMLVACTPQLGERAFGEPGSGVLLLSVAAGAALAANAVLARCPPVTPDGLLGGSALVMAAALLLAATGQPLLVVTAALAMGAADGPQLTALFAVRHREAPERLRAQVFTTGASLKITAFAVGAALAGTLSAWSLPGALATAAGCALLAAGVYVRSGVAYVRRRRH